MSGRQSAERLEGVELLRFVLAFGVVVYHYYFFGPHMRLIPLAPIDSIGLDALMFGVEAFFAVSGLVIIVSTAGRTPVEFMVARFSRLAPTLLAASSVTLATYYALNVEPRLSGAGLKYLVSITFFPLARLSGGLDPSLWSLSFEIRFYLLVFLCMFLFDVRKNALSLAVGLLAYDAVRLLASWLVADGMPPRLDPLRDYAPFFALGILLYHRRAMRTSGTVFLLSMGAALLLGAIRITQLFDHMDRVTLGVGPVPFWRGAAIECVILAAMIASLLPVRRAGLVRVFRVAGRASYPLYVVHQLCGYWIINFLAGRLHLHIDPRPLIIAVLVAASLAFGNLIEPSLIRLYRGMLEDAVGILASLSPRRAAVRAAQASARENA